MRNRNKRTQSGNVFFIILIGIALFAALAMVISRGMRGQGTTAMSEREAELAAVDIMNYAQQMERTVNRLRRVNGCSENEISFDNDVVSGYDFSTRDECKVFHDDGGRLSYPKNIKQWLGKDESIIILYGEIVFSARLEVDGVGSDCDDKACTDLILYLPYVKKEICKQINKKLNLPAPSSLIHEGIGSFAPGGNTKFIGGYVKAHTSAIIGDDQLEMSGQHSGCIYRTNQSDHYNYYHTLIAR